MEKWICEVCGYIYDPDIGDDDGEIPSGTLFADIPADWICPICGAEKNEFSAEETEE